jgi:hypothetical protein
VDKKIRVLYFIGQCLSLDEHPSFRETIIVQFSEPDYDWNSFIWTCSNHLVLPAIYLKFRKHDLLGYLPEVLAQHLEEIHSLNRERNAKIIEQMKEITATLNRANISPVYLKGTGNLIDGIYSDMGERIIGDIDLLVPEGGYLKAVELAKAIGYENHWGEPRNPEKLKHYPGLYRADVPADIEIHRLPVVPEYLKHFNSEMIFAQKTAVEGHAGCFVAGINHKIIQNFIHSQLSNAGDRLGVVSLRDVYDLYCFSKRADLQKTIQDAPYRQKYINYLKISEQILDLPGRFCPVDEKASQLYQLKYSLNSSSTLFFKINRLVWVISVALKFGFKRIAASLSDSKLFRNDLKSGWHSNNLKMFLEMYKGKN